MASEQTSPSYEAMRTGLADRDINLHPELDKPFPRLYSEMAEGKRTTCANTSPWIGAISLAGELLRSYPDTELAGRPLPAEAFSSEPDTAQRVFRRVVNASLGADEPKRWERDWSVRPSRRTAACLDSERRFCETFQSMGHRVAGTRRPELGYDLLTDGDEIVAVQKFHEVRSTLSLVPLRMNGIPYPAGSILRTDIRNTGRTNLTDPAEIPFDKVHHAAFIRLSAFALPPSERTDHAMAKLAEGMDHLTPQHLRDTARQALRHLRR